MGFQATSHPILHPDLFSAWLSNITVFSPLCILCPRQTWLTCWPHILLCAFLILLSLLGMLSLPLPYIQTLLPFKVTQVPLPPLLEAGSPLPSLTLSIIFFVPSSPSFLLLFLQELTVLQVRARVTSSLRSSQCPPHRR